MHDGNREYVLFLAVVVVTHLPVGEQDREIHRVKVGDGGPGAGCQRVTKCHQEVAAARTLEEHGTIGRTRTSSWDDVICPTNHLSRALTHPQSRRIAGLQEGVRKKVNKGYKHTLWVAAVAEVILLAICRSENIVAGAMDEEDEGCISGTELDVGKGEVSRLKGVDERNPGEVTDGKHETESVSGDVHSRKDCGLRGGERMEKSTAAGTHLVVKSIGNVPNLEEEDEPHGVSDGTGAAGGLFTGHGDVDEDPKDHPGAELIEGLDVKGADGRVQLAADVELSEESTCN